MKVLGIKTITRQDKSYRQASKTMIDYEIYLEQGKILVKNTYQDCYSGYTSCTYGSLNYIVNCNKEARFDLIPKKEIQVDPLNIQYCKSYQQVELLSKKFAINCFLSHLKYLVDDHDNLVAYSDEDGGDGYYPCGRASINFELFEKI